MADPTAKRAQKPPAPTTNHVPRPEHLFESIFENLLEPVCLATPDGRAIAVNQACLDLFGYCREEAAHTNILEIYVHPEERQRVLQELYDKGVVRDYEVLARRKDGSKFRCQFTSRLVRSGDGEPVRIFAVVRDVTDRRRREAELENARYDLAHQVQARTAELSRANEQLMREIDEHAHAEQALRESESRYRILAENVNDVIWMADLNFGITYVSPSVKNLIGRSPEELHARDLRDLITPASYEQGMARVMQEIEREAAGGHDPNRSWLNEFELVRKDGSTLWAEIRGSFLRGPDGKPEGMLGVARDISERKRLEKELRQAQKLEAVGRLAGGVAHDFNNLMTALCNYTDLLLADVDDSSPLRENALEIRKVGERGAALTRQLLAFSIKQTQRLALLDLNEVIKSTEPMLRRLIGERVHLRIALRSGLGEILADRNQIEQVLLNLVLNARDAMPGGGTVSVETEWEDLEAKDTLGRDLVPSRDFIVLKVRDSGVGMDSETLGQIFDPFFTTKEQGKGTGLGLSTVYGIVKQSGGQIRVKSKLGQGSTFQVYFRVARRVAPETSQPRPESELAAELGHQGRETILLVEDEDVVRNPIRTVLEKMGYRVLEAANGQAALDLCGQHSDPLHLVITDIVMPRITGPELVRTLTRTRPDLKVLYISGYNRAAGRSCLQMGPEENFLPKPFSPLELVQKVRQILDSAG